MDNFNVNLTINDLCCTNCNRSEVKQTLNIYDSSTIISLQDDYTLRILSVNSNRVIIEIRKNYMHFIRFGYIAVPINVLLSSSENCSYKQYITITINSIVAG